MVCLKLCYLVFRCAFKIGRCPMLIHLTNDKL